MEHLKTNFCAHYKSPFSLHTLHCWLVLAAFYELEWLLEVIGVDDAFGSANFTVRAASSALVDALESLKAYGCVSC
eukprot:5925860-Pleurochrysis_carterae.AAC.2